MLNFFMVGLLSLKLLMRDQFPDLVCQVVQHEKGAFHCVKYWIELSIVPLEIRRQRSKLIVVKSVFGFLIIGAVSTVSLMAGQAGVLRKAPELAFNIPGQGEKLLSQFRGKVVALEFILTTCAHCQAASKVMTKFQEEFGKRGFQALDLAINALDGQGGNTEADELVSAFSKNFRVGFPVGYLPRAQMMNFTGFSMADRMVVPQLVLIDRKGFIHYQTPAGSGPEWDKQMNDSALREHIEELLALGGATTAAPKPKSKMVASAAKK